VLEPIQQGLLIIADEARRGAVDALDLVRGWEYLEEQRLRVYAMEWTSEDLNRTQSVVE
jgi:hypothetical protein